MRARGLFSVHKLQKPSERAFSPFPRSKGKWDTLSLSLSLALVRGTKGAEPRRAISSLRSSALNQRRGESERPSEVI